MKRTPIKPRSRKASQTEAARAKIRKALIEERGSLCEARTPYCTQPAVLQMHEVLSRGRGGDALDPSNILLVCPLCHHWIHTHPADAEARGLSVRRWPRA